MRISAPLLPEVMRFLSASTVRFHSSQSRSAFFNGVDYPLAHLLGDGVELPKLDPIPEDPFSCDVSLNDVDALSETVLSPYSALISLLEFTNSDLLAPILSELNTRDAINRLSASSRDKAEFMVWIIVDGLRDVRSPRY